MRAPPLPERHNQRRKPQRGLPGSGAAGAAGAGIGLGGDADVVFAA